MRKNVVESKHTEIHVSSINRFINLITVKCLCEGNGTLKILFKYGFIFSNKTLVFCEDPRT